MDKPLTKLKKSELLARGAWRSLMLDKKLVTIPLISFGFSMIVLALFIAIAAVNPSGAVYTYSGQNTTSNTTFDLSIKPLGYAMFILFGVLASIASGVSIGAVTYGALQRFRGSSPTVKDCFRAAWRHKAALLGFILFSYTIGLIINELANRIPYVGSIVVSWLAGAAWGIASFFAIPIIVDDEKYNNPISATKKSLAIIKQIWGESLILAVGLGAFQFLVVILYSALVMVGAMAVAILGNFMPSVLIPGIILAAISVVGLAAIAFMFTMLEMFVKAALYYYATTGESPATFDKNILRQAFTPKKAKKVFSF